MNLSTTIQNSQLVMSVKKSALVVQSVQNSLCVKVENGTTLKLDETRRGIQGARGGTGEGVLDLEPRLLMLEEGVGSLDFDFEGQINGALSF